MSLFLEWILDLFMGFISTLLEARFGSFEWPDTLAARIFWGTILVITGVVLWRELR